MRVIGGSARSIPLRAPSGDGTRPTTDRIKETLFNILQPDIVGCRFLDLFAGSGGIGIEALSRGADEAVFVESGRDALACIRANLEKTGLWDRATVLPMDWRSALRKLGREGKPFGLIFLDPPYGKGWDEEALRALAASPLATDGTQIIAEVLADREVARLEASGLRAFRVKEYRTNKHVFLRKG